ncbi:MAG TPA: helix-turn-helix domain-containing protein [Myxococcota bacterium]
MSPHDLLNPLSLESSVPAPRTHPTNPLSESLAAAHAEGKCPSANAPGVVLIREILGRVGDKWSLLIVGALRTGPVRFNALKRDVDGISQRMLTLTLKGLERDGIVTRTVTPTVPPRVDYALTPLGLSLFEHVVALTRWTETSFEQILAARAAYDARDVDDHLS